MKTTRRILALITVLALVLAMGTTAFADETPVKNNSITITNAKVGETYKIYKLFDLVVDDEFDPKAYTYKVNSDWAAFFAADGAGAQYITVNAAGAVSINGSTDAQKEANAAALAKAAANWTGKPSSNVPFVTVAEGANTAVFNNLADGYYLVTSTLGTIAMAETTPDKGAVTINEKNPENTITKQVKEDSKTQDAYGSTNDAQIGDTVEFKSVVTLNPGTRNVKVTDTMTSGLTYEGDAAIEGLTKNTHYTITESATGFVITFTDAYINGLSAATTLTLTYSATLNEAAVADKAITDQTNSIVISYGDKQSVDATTTTTTHKFSVLKYDGGKFAPEATNKTALAGAVFSLKKADNVVSLIKIDDNNYRIAKAGETGVATFTTNSNGAIVIWGVDADNDYSLEEITPPAGYNELTAEVGVIVEANNSTVAQIANQTGTELPSTGGMGTTIFYVLGGLMVLGALVVLVTNKRMRAN